MERNKVVYLIGIGMGDTDYLISYAEQRIAQADIYIGAKRMLEPFEIYQGRRMLSYKPKEMKEYLLQEQEWQSAVVLLSGDSGFFSGAKGILEEFADTPYEIQCIPGISSISYFSAKLGMNWEDMYIASAHGRQENLIGRIAQNERTFALLGGGRQLKELCEKLQYYGMNEIRLFVGENLSYAAGTIEGGERIIQGSPAEMQNQSFGNLICMIAENPALQKRMGELKDEEFIRGKVPMTKCEVRTVSIAKLDLQENSVFYDIGAGTGSVSIEIAAKYPGVKVYAIEKNEEAVSLIQENKQKFGTDNVEIISGEALEILHNSQLDMPTHVFVGGSGGNFKEMAQWLFTQNPRLHMVANAVTLNSIAEIYKTVEELQLQAEVVSMNVSKSKKMGGYHMMIANNPVYIFTIKAADR